MSDNTTDTNPFQNPNDFLAPSALTPWIVMIAVYVAIAYFIYKYW